MNRRTPFGVAAGPTGSLARSPARVVGLLAPYHRWMIRLIAPCPDCGARLPEIDGPVHPYLGGSAACWAAFGELGARELALGIPGPGRLSVHAYAVQHPGLEARRQSQSVGVHLMVLGVVLERGLPTEEAVALMPAWLAGKPAFPWLAPPSSRATLTLLDLPAVDDRAAHEAAVRGWADAVWADWSAHRATVREWLDTGHPSGARSGSRVPPR